MGDERGSSPSWYRTGTPHKQVMPYCQGQYGYQGAPGVQEATSPQCACTAKTGPNALGIHYSAAPLPSSSSHRLCCCQPITHQGAANIFEGLPLTHSPSSSSTAAAAAVLLVFLVSAAYMQVQEQTQLDQHLAASLLCQGGRRQLPWHAHAPKSIVMWDTHPPLAAGHCAEPCCAVLCIMYHWWQASWAVR